MKNTQKMRWITGNTVSRTFKLGQNEMIRLRVELTGTCHLKRPEIKKNKKSSNFWYDLDYLLNRFTPRQPIPAHLIREDS